MKESNCKNFPGSNATFFDSNLGIQNMQQHFKLLTDNISEGLAHCQIICDENEVPIDYKVLSVNKAYERHTGIKKEQIVGKRIKEIVPDMEQSWIALYGEVARTQQTKSISGYNKKTNRHYHSTAYSNKKGEFMMLFEDKTEQVELEKAIKNITDNNKLKSELLENLQEGFKHCRVICNEKNEPIDFKIIAINDAYTKLTGISKELIVGNTMLEAFPKMDQKKFDKFCKVGMTGVSENFIDHCNITGKVFDISSFSPSPKEFIWIVRDITEKEKARLNLEEAYKKVEKSEKLKTAFLANMSHEIRTPLNAILGFSELLEEKTLSKEDEKKCLSHIKNSGNKLLTIISDILDISKLDSNEQTLIYSKNNLNKIIDSLKEQFVLINNNPKIIKINTSKALNFNDSYINTDATRLEQILSNLIENALKYTNVGSVEFGYTIKEEFIEFFVSDTGIGIAHKHQKSIFERFNQINQPNGRINQGTGLGVSIAYGFVQLFGGNMWVDSEINKGSTFFFKIPYLPISIIENIEQ